MLSDSAVQKINVFRDFDKSERSALAALMSDRQIPKGNYILFADDYGTSVMFLLEGTAKVTLLSSDGREVVLHRLGPGDIFGELAVMTDDRRSANVVATSDCVVCFMKSADFKAQLEKDSRLAVALCKELSIRLNIANTKIESLAFFDVYGRVCRALKELAAPGKNSKEKSTMVIENRPTHQELANMIGTSREVITRTLKDLELDDCIKIENDRIELRHMPDF